MKSIYALGLVFWFCKISMAQESPNNLLTESKVNLAKQEPTKANIESLWKATLALPETGDLKDSAENWTKLATLLDLIQIVNGQIVESENSKKPTLNVDVPDMNVPPGTDPNAISDPVLRQRYKAAIILNKNLIEKENFQAFLRILRNKSHAYYESFVMRGFSRAEMTKVKKQTRDILGNSANDYLKD